MSALFYNLILKVF